MSTKEIVLSSAKQRFLERGFHGTSMRDITNASGVSQGGIYSYFNSKEDLFKEVLNQAIPFDTFIENINSLLTENDEPEIFFRKFATIFLKSFKIETMKLRMIDFLEFKGKYFQILLEEKIKNNNNPIIDKIQRYINDGKIIDTNPTSLLLAFIMSVFSYLFLKSYVLEKQPNEDELIKTINIFLYGALQKKEKQYEKI